MHKKDYAFWSVVMVAGAVGATAVLNVSNLQSAPSQNADIYRKIDLFGEVFERVRQDYVEKPDEGAMRIDPVRRHLADARERRRVVDAEQARTGVAIVLRRVEQPPIARENAVARKRPVLARRKHHRLAGTARVERHREGTRPA